MKKSAKWISIITAGALSVSGLGMYMSNAKGDTVVAQETQSTPTMEVLEDVMEQTMTSHSFETGKEETVYVITDANGNADNVIVSAWLKNGEGSDTISDVSSLSSIENVKGDETFDLSAGNVLTWNANGSDIYYQGTTDQELPVTMKITYYLNDEEISPEELAGKSGHVRIRFDYENHVTKKVEVAGKETELYVPFAVVSGMMLPLDHFTNIKISNGKIISDGNNDIVVGLAFPGLSEDLSLGEVDLSSLEALGVEVPELSIELPNYVEVEADVQDFRLAMTMSMVMSDSLTNVDLSGNIDLNGVSVQLDELKDSVTLLGDSSALLVDGSVKLAEGSDTLLAGVKALSTGAGTLESGLETYTQGVSTLAGGITSAKTGADTLCAGAKTLYENMATAKAGSYSLATGLDSAYAGSQKIAGGVKTLSDALSGTVAQLKDAHDKYVAISNGMNTLMQGGLDEGQAICIAVLQMDAGTVSSMASAAAAYASDPGTYAAYAQTAQTYAGFVSAGKTIYSLLGSLNSIYEGLGSKSGDIAALVSGANALSQGIATADQGAWTLYKGMDQLTTGSGTLYAGAQQLDEGLAQLESGVQTLAANNETLVSGGKALVSGAAQLVDGATTLSEGAHTLNVGMTTFDKDGIQTLVSLVNALNLNQEAELLERFEAVLDIADDYRTFTGAPEGMDSSVKFIIRSGAIGE